MIDELLRLATESGLQILGRVYGNELSDNLVVFCHGFGVKSDSRGMFTTICESLKEHSLTIRFHFVTIDDISQDTFITSYRDQVEKLETVISRMRLKYPNKKLVVISHSQGCWISSMLLEKSDVKPTLHIMMAPSPTKNVAERMRIKLTTRDGAVLDEQGVSIYPRTDGTKTILLPTFWKDAVTINPQALFEKATKRVPTVIIWAKNDTTIAVENLPMITALPKKSFYELPNGHDFSEDNAKGVIEIIKSELNSI